MRPDQFPRGADLQLKLTFIILCHITYFSAVSFFVAIMFLKCVNLFANLTCLLVIRSSKAALMFKLLFCFVLFFGTL